MTLVGNSRGRAGGNDSIRTSGGVLKCWRDEAASDCLKEDLKDFLVANSLHDLLADEAVPVHAVHGSADTLVPYQRPL